MNLGATDQDKLRGVHPDLIKVVNRAVILATQAGLSFKILEGVRSTTQQAANVRNGVSGTMKSRHIPATSKAAPQYAHAFDAAPVIGGKVSWAWPAYYPLAVIFKQAAKDCGIPIEWGGDWKTFKDGPHWQLPWSKYP